MDKKSANGFSSKPSESGGQRKQLPYSVETPYGFHLDLDFLKYVDDIEKGNTIKRVHIHRRAKGPKFSTLPRNFSLPGHGARPAPKDSWSGTATLGPKPKSRLAEVQQIYDFRPGDGGATSSQTQSKALGGIVSSAKPREEASVGSRVFEEKPLELKGRPNLLRASSMPITVQHRKGSDSGSPDRVVGTPENGSSENVFRASDATDRRSVPQDRIGLHQQITVALKRVRELEEQVRTIPELKAQICSLREEREQLILRLQAQVKAQAQAQSASFSQSQSSDPGTDTEPPGRVGAQGASRDQSSAEPGAASDRLAEQQQAGLEPSALAGSSAPEMVKELHGESIRSSTAEEEKSSVGGQETQVQPAQKSDQHRELHSEKGSENIAEQPSNDVTGESSLHTAAVELAESASTRLIEAGSTSAKDASLASCAVDNEGLGSVQQLQAKLKSLEVKLIGACQELEDTNTQLKEQVAENRLKEERIQELCGDVGAVGCPDPGRKRRESVDRETETENSSTVDQGTDTEQIVVCVVRPRANSIDQGTETERVDTVDRVTETGGAEMECPARPRANSVDRETETERVDTVDQVTETPAPETVDRVTETAPAGSGMAQADIVDQGTEMESVARVDRVTETVRVRSSDQQTETERNRRGNNNNPASGGAEEVGDRFPQSGVNIEILVTESEVVEEEESGITEIFVTEARFEDEIVVGINGSSEAVAKERHVMSEKAIVAVVASEVTEPETSAGVAAAGSAVAESVVSMAFLTKTNAGESTGVESMEEVSCMVTQRVVRESPAANTETIPVRPQRARRVSPDQPQAPAPLQAPASPEPHVPTPDPAPATVPIQAQAPPQRPRRGSREPQLQPSEPNTLTQSQASPQTHQGAGEAKVGAEAPIAHQAPIQATGEIETQQPRAESKQHPQQQAQLVPECHGQSQTQPEMEAQTQPEIEAQTQPEIEAQTQPEIEAQTQPEIEAQTQPEIEAQTQPEIEAQTQPEIEVQTKPQIEAQAKPQTEAQAKPEIEAQTKPEMDAQTQSENEDKTQQDIEALTQPEAKVQDQLVESQTVVKQAEPVLLTQPEAQPKPQPEPQTKQSDSKPQRPGPKTRRDSKEMKTTRRDSKELQTPRRGSGESQAQVRRGSRESQSQPPRRGSKDTPQPDSANSQAPRRGSSESPTSPAALGQVVTRLTGLLGEQWAQLGSGAGAQQQQQQQGTSQQESSTVQKAAPVKRAVAAAAGAKTAAKSPGGGKPTGKAGPSKMSSIQSQLVSSLSVLSAFYSPGQKAAANKQQGLKSIMKKNDRADKQGNGGAKKNLKFVGVNGGYETTSSEDSSGDEKAPEVEEEVDSSEPEELQEERPVEPLEPVTQREATEAVAQEGATVAGEQGSHEDHQEPGTSENLLDYKSTGGPVNKDFMEACLYVKDRMEEVSSPDKDMRKVLLVLYQEWFRVSSQRDSQADTVTLYLREVGLATPTLLRYVVNLTDGNGNTALHYSVSHSNFPVVKLLLDTGLCETDSQNKAGYTAVMLASLTAADSKEDLEVALQLLKQGHVNTRASQAGQTALMLAVSHGRTAMVRLLLSCQADPNLQDVDGSTALMGACDHGHAEIVRLLLDTGLCNTGLTDKNGQTALTIATQASHGEIVDLLKAYADAM